MALWGGRYSLDDVSVTHLDYIDQGCGIKANVYATPPGVFVGKFGPASKETTYRLNYFPKRPVDTQPIRHASNFRLPMPLKIYDAKRYWPIACREYQDIDCDCHIKNYKCHHFDKNGPRTTNVEPKYYYYPQPKRNKLTMNLPRGHQYYSLDGVEKHNKYLAASSGQQPVENHDWGYDEIKLYPSLRQYGSIHRDWPPKPIPSYQPSTTRIQPWEWSDEDLKGASYTRDVTRRAEWQPVMTEDYKTAAIRAHESTYATPKPREMNDNIRKRQSVMKKSTPIRVKRENTATATNEFNRTSGENLTWAPRYFSSPKRESMNTRSQYNQQPQQFLESTRLQDHHHPAAFSSPLKYTSSSPNNQQHHGHALSSLDISAIPPVNQPRFSHSPMVQVAPAPTEDPRIRHVDFSTQAPLHHTHITSTPAHLPTQQACEYQPTRYHGHQSSPNRDYYGESVGAFDEPQYFTEYLDNTSAGLFQGPFDGQNNNGQTEWLMQEYYSLVPPPSQTTYEGMCRDVADAPNRAQDFLNHLSSSQGRQAR